MPGALLGAASCVRCGAAAQSDDRCPRCDLVWIEAIAADPVRGEPGLLGGVVRAAPARRVLAALVDLLALAIFAAPGAYLLVQDRVLGWLLIAVAVLTLLVQAVFVVQTGRSLGRLLLGLRTVDDLNGSPVRFGRLGRMITGGEGRPRLITADLRQGRDPEQVPGLTAPAPVARAATAAPAAAQATPTPRRGRARSTMGPRPVEDRVDDPRDDRGVHSAPEARPASPTTPDPAGADSGAAAQLDESTSGTPEPVAASLAAFSAGHHRGVQPSVGILTDGGDAYEVEQVLLIGRSPVDPHPGPGRMVLAWPDLSRRLAKTHLMLEWSGTVLWVTDLESLTGTSVSTPDGSRVPLAPGVRFAAGIGSVISCGGRSITVVPHV